MQESWDHDAMEVSLSLMASAAVVVVIAASAVVDGVRVSIGDVPELKQRKLMRIS